MRTLRRLVSMALTAVMAVAVISSFGFAINAGTKDNTPVYSYYNGSGKPAVFEYKSEGGTTEHGYALVPSTPGSYRTVILYCGLAGNYIWMDQDLWLEDKKVECNNLVDNLNNWVANGYIEPVVVLMPWVTKTDDLQRVDDVGTFFNYAKSPFVGLMNSITNGTLKSSEADLSKIDPSKGISVGGVSMGGASALYAAIVNKGKNWNLTTVGGLSPAQKLYLNSSSGYIRSASDFKVHAGVKVFMTYGHMENGKVDNDFKANVERYAKAFRGNGVDVTTLEILYGHGTENADHMPDTFMKAIFSFIWFTQKGTTPDWNTIVKATEFTPSEIPVAPSSNVTVGGPIKGDVKLIGSAKVGQTLTCEVSNCNGENFTYYWRIGSKYNTTNHTSTYTIQSGDVGKTIFCFVKDHKNHGNTYIYAYTGAVTK